MDLDRFVRSVVRIRNESGGRGYDGGLRAFDCPLCGDSRARGWVGVTGYGAGCFNPGCPAEPTLPGGAVEWARRVLRLATRAEAWRHLEKNFGSAAATHWAPSLRSEDFCRVPPHLRSFELEATASPLQLEFSRFLERQWGVADPARSDLRWCVRGKYALRVWIPVVMFGRTVGFQARAVRDGAEPKYVTSRHGEQSDPEAECGRPAAAMLYNIDAVRAGAEVVLVEGAGDAMGWRASGSTVPAVAILGVALTTVKLSLLYTARPSRVVVALDDEPDAQSRARSHVEDLRTWGLEATVGRWVGGKDAGSGAALAVEADWSLGAAVRARLGHQETDGVAT